LIAHDISAVIDALPTWFGDRADTSRVGVMGHSRGAQTALAAAGASPFVNGDLHVKAIMGLAAVVVPINIQNITVPAALVAGALDTMGVFLQYSLPDFDMMSSKKKELGLIGQATHAILSRHCAQSHKAPEPFTTKRGVISASSAFTRYMHGNGKKPEEEINSCVSMASSVNGRGRNHLKRKDHGNM
jgi:predicted dienelactone hydrolase